MSNKFDDLVSIVNKKTEEKNNLEWIKKQKKIEECENAVLDLKNEINLMYDLY